MPLGCQTLVPLLSCRQADLLIYLIPAFALAVLIRVLASFGPAGFALLAYGTLCHELAHALVGLLTNARPRGLSIWPERTGPGQWRLGSVSFQHLRWYNAAPAALAPLLLLPVPLVVAWYRTAQPWHFMPRDLLLNALVAPLFLSFWPSWTDWKLALRSWPYLFLIAAGLWWRFKM